MRRAQIPISALPAWMKLNDVVFTNIKVEDLGAKGLGLVSERPLSSEDNIPALLNVPKDLIISTEAVAEHARVDRDFRELLDAAGGISTRGDILLFLLMQITITSPDCPHGIGVSNPWTEYVKMLPLTVPVPTMWTDEQRHMLIGTSLEARGLYSSLGISALITKRAALLREFERLRDITSGISWAQKIWWESETLGLNDWVLLDAWYRSRCLELPVARESMVPCIDLANHGTNSNCFYEQTNNADVVLLLKPNQRMEVGEEISIDYGPGKSAAEMLFSYGFIGEDIRSNSLVLDLHPISDDPLGKAKVAVFSGAPVVRISTTEDIIQWSSPFLFLLCLNEEDGLKFRTLQQMDGSQGQLQVFWQGSDVTCSTDNFQEYTNQHPMKEIFILRAVVLLQDRVQDQLERIYISEELVESLRNTSYQVETLKMASRLRILESALLEKVLDLLESQKSALIDNPLVIEYLKSMSGGSDIPVANMTNDEGLS